MTAHKVHSRRNLFNDIDRVHELLYLEVTPERKDELEVLINKIYVASLLFEGTAMSYFDEKVLSRLRKLFPNYPYLDPKYEVSHFTDSVELLVGGKDAFGRILKEIKKAKKSIEVQMFIWKNDKIGNLIGQALLDAANRGVKVNINKDALGSVYESGGFGKRGFFASNPSELSLRILQKTLSIAYSENGEFQSHDFKVADALVSHKNVKVDSDTANRDHSKFYIIDNKILILGGMNIGDEYYIPQNIEGKTLLPRHDFMVCLESYAAVRKFRHRFKGSHVDNFDKGSSFEFSFNLGHKKDQFEISKHLSDLLHFAQNHVEIEMAYLGDKLITQALIDLANRGVKVDLILPKQSNLQDDFNKAVLRKVLKKTDPKFFNVYFFPRPLHSKVLMIDKKISYLGSANFNSLALRSLGETNIMVVDKDADFTRKLSAALLKDKRASKRYKGGALSFNPLNALLEKIIDKLF